MENSKKLLAIYKPLVILITRVEYSKPAKFVSELIKMKIPVQIIALKSKMDGDEFALRLFEHLRRSALRSVRKARVMEWNIEKPVRNLIVEVAR